MFQKLCYILILLIGSCTYCFAQDLETKIGNNKDLDSLRKKEMNKRDSIVFNSKYIRFTTLRATRDTIQTFPIDTTLNNFQNYSVLNQPRRPTIGLGNLGLAAKPLLFEPNKSIGFDPGFHALDFYALNPQDVLYYRARSPFSSLYYVNGGLTEQVFKVIYTQNVHKNLNIGANFNRIGADGIYNRQRGDDLGVSLFSWYQSPNNRYSLFASIIINTLKAAENGAITNGDIFGENALKIDKMAEPVRLNTARQLWRKSGISLRNQYFIGRIDSVKENGYSKILPTNKLTYSFNYFKESFMFFKNEKDDHTAIPEGITDNPFYGGYSKGFTKDTTSMHHIQNEFLYSFFLRPKSGFFSKNELKIDAGIRHDFYQYNQTSQFFTAENIYSYSKNFQNITLLGNAGYKLSEAADLNVSIEQIIQGPSFGDYLYEGKSTINLSSKAGKIILGAYIQNKSPEQIFEKHFSNHYQWDVQFKNSKTFNASFGYFNKFLNFDALANYYLLSNYLYFGLNGINAIKPLQEMSDISLLQITAGKKFNIGNFGIELFAAFQKANNEQVLRTPSFYTFNTINFKQTFFKVLKTEIGIDVKYNDSYLAYSYSAPASQFYVGDAVSLGTHPILNLWIKAGLRRASLLVKYDYVNQGIPTKGYYTVSQYPMGGRLFKFGVLWNFYD